MYWYHVGNELATLAVCAGISAVALWLAALAARIKAFRIRLAGTGSFAQAQVTRGGVSTAEIDPVSLQSLRCPGLYFAGELIDVDGPCGGYNLQWAFASGLTAGERKGYDDAQDQ